MLLLGILDVFDLIWFFDVTSSIDCSLRFCPKGDDPGTSGFYDIQMISCRCIPGCHDGVVVSFLGEGIMIPHDATESQITHYLSRLTTLESFTVDVLVGSTICSNSPDGSITQLTIEIPQGPQGGNLNIAGYGDFTGVMGIASDGEYISLNTNRKKKFLW